MASLQAKHSTRCALDRPWTPFDEAVAGCTCPDGPIYYIVVREGDQAHKEAVGRDRQHAQFALHRAAVALEDGDFRPRLNIGFSEWADRWLDSLERKPTTIGSYRSTIVHAKDTFGGQRVRRIGAEDIARFNRVASRARLLALDSGKAPARAWRLSTGCRLLPLCGLEPGTGVAAGAEAAARAEGGGVLRER